MILLPAMQDVMQKAKVKSTIWFLKPLLMYRCEKAIWDLGVYGTDSLEDENLTLTLTLRLR